MSPGTSDPHLLPPVPAGPQQTLQAVRRILAQYLEIEVDEVRPDAKLFELPEVDSLKLAVAWVRFEREFGVCFEVNADAVTMTVAELAQVASHALRGS